MSGSRWPHLADEGDIRQWAEYRIEARHEFPRLVRDLIRQTNDQVARLEMRAGKGTDVPGYDGVVEAAKATPFVPAGLSVWELGTGADPQGKANADYQARTADSLGLEKSATTFVFATPRQWAGKAAWAAAKKADGRWADVRALDVADIEIALEAAPAAHLRFSELVGKPATGVRTIEDWWSRYSVGTQPALTPDLVLAGRADAAGGFLRLLQEERKLITIAAPSTDDVLAFVAGALHTSPEPERLDLLGRTLIVHDAASFRMLEGGSNLLILLPFEEELRRVAELAVAHQVVFLASPGTPSDIELPGLDRDVFASMLQELGVTERNATRLARAAHRSIVAFRREPASGGEMPRMWSTLLQSRVARRAWLAASWNEGRSGDTDVLTELFGIEYEDARGELEPLSSGEDPFFARVGTAWALVSPEEAWRAGAAVVDDFDLTALEATVQTVLGAVDPALDLPAQQRWTASLYGKTRLHSSDLRGGLASTLALAGARGDTTRLGSVGPIANWASSVVAQLLRRANKAESGQLWASLTDVLPLLAEAAPEAFLRALQEGVAEPTPVLEHIFTDKAGDALSVSSPHTGLLWALEITAWSSEHAALSIRLLARLAEIDPGGRLSNRPLNSLADIFRPWLPQTSLTTERRIAVLNALRRDHEQVAWDLMLLSLPEPHSVGRYSRSPRFRAWKPEKEGVTSKEFWDFSSAVAEVLIESAAAVASRWVQLVARLDDFPPSQRAAATERMSAIAREEGSTGLRRAVWAAVDELVRRHRAFADADWALAAEEVDRLAAVADELKPEDPVETSRWLFDTHLPDLGAERVGVEERLEAVAAARKAAIGAVLEADGVDGVLHLARAADIPGFVGVAWADHATPESDERVRSLLDDPDSKLASVARAYSFERVRNKGWSWLIQQLDLTAGRPLAQARLLQATDDLGRAWTVTREQGPEVEQAYWGEFTPMGRGADFPLVNEAARGLLDHGFVVTALDMLSLYARRESNPVSAELILEGLERLVELPHEHAEAGRVSSYELDQLLDALRQSEVDEERVATLEWRLLPALGFRARSPVLERRLSRDPAFFVEIVSLCFRPRGAEGEALEVPEHVARNAYRLLDEWKIVPGSSDRMAEVDEDELIKWTTTARELLAEARRREVGDIYIGHVFAHARGDADGSWPTRPVRNAIERIASPDIEDGLQTQIYNNRGVTSRSPMSGGDPERELASRYRHQAEQIRDEWPRTAAALTSLAAGYEREARRHDEEAERFREGLEE